VFYRGKTPHKKILNRTGLRAVNGAPGHIQCPEAGHVRVEHVPFLTLVDPNLHDCDWLDLIIAIRVHWITILYCCVRRVPLTYHNRGKCYKSDYDNASKKHCSIKHKNFPLTWFVTTMGLRQSNREIPFHTESILAILLDLPRRVVSSVLFRGILSRYA